MSFPRLTIFCAKGHQTVMIKTPEEVDCQEAKVCPVCGEKNLKAVPNWPEEYTILVPVKPVGQVRGISFYDVTALFAEDAGRQRSLSFFCERGHLAAVTNKPDGDEAQKLKPCDACGSKHFRAVFDWLQAKECIVPAEPILTEGIQEVYDVSRLFAPGFSCEWEIDLDQLFPAVKPSGNESG